MVTNNVKEKERPLCALKNTVISSSSTLWENYWVRQSTYMGCFRHPLLPHVQMLNTYVLRMDNVLHQSCKIWLPCEICTEFLNDGPLSYNEVNRFCKTGKQCLLISLLLQRTLSLQEFQYNLHDPENTELVLVLYIHLTCSHQTQTTDWFCSLSWKEGSTVPRNSCKCIQFSRIVFCSYMGYELIMVSAELISL